MFRSIRRALFTLFIILSGVILSFGFAREFYLLEQTNFRQEFKSISEKQVREIDQAAQDCLAAIENAGAFFETRGSLDRVEFRAIAQRIFMKFPYIQKLEWAPRVPGEERAAWEARAVQEGTEASHVAERTADGRLVPAPERAEYFPVFYVEPSAGPEPWAGFDLASTGEGRDAVNRARDGGALVIAPPMRLLKDRQERGVFYVLRPVFSQNPSNGGHFRPEDFRGVILAVVSGPDLAQKVFGQFALQQMDVVIWDKTIPSRPQPLYYRGIGGAEWKAIEDHLEAGRGDDVVFEYTIRVGSRTWSVFMMPRSRWNWIFHPWPIIIFIGGVLVTLIGFYIFVINKEKEAEVRHQKTALDHHAIVSRTDSAGKITYVNDKFCELAQYSRSELMGQSHRMLGSGYHTKEFFEDLWRTITQGRAWQGQLRNRAKDGTFYWVETTIKPFLNDRGQPREYIAIQTDITRNIENEKRIESAMQMKSDFIATVSHELRTPLASIKATLDVILSGTPGPVSPDQGRFLGKAKANIDRLKRLIDDFLDLSKLESGIVELNKVPTDLVSVINSVVEIQKNVADKKGLGLRVQVDAGLPLVVCDGDKVSEVFINFVNNALKFTEKGEVVVEARLVPEEAVVRCAVRDTGEGIAAEGLPKLFGKFQQLGDPAKRKAGGTGLGLAICREIVTRHGGKVWVESEKGKGSSFIFTLPVQGAV